MAAIRKRYRVLSSRSEFGRSSETIECPFCGERFIGYVWSMAGKGKRCPNPTCRALHSDGFAEKEES